VTAIYVAVRKTEIERVRPNRRVRPCGRFRWSRAATPRVRLHALAALPAEPDDIVLVTTPYVR